MAPVAPLHPGEERRVDRLVGIFRVAVGAVALADLAADEAVGVLLAVEVVERLDARQRALSVEGEQRHEAGVPLEDVFVEALVEVGRDEAVRVGAGLQPGARDGPGLPVQGDEVRPVVEDRARQGEAQRVVGRELAELVDGQVVHQRAGADVGEADAAGSPIGRHGQAELVGRRLARAGRPGFREEAQAVGPHANPVPGAALEVERRARDDGAVAHDGQRAEGGVLAAIDDAGAVGGRVVPLPQEQADLVAHGGDRRGDEHAADHVHVVGERALRDEPA